MQVEIAPQAGADYIRPFQIEALGIRGRAVRLTAVADEIIRKHAYPEPVARLLAEMLTVSAALASALKYDGVFTLQTKSDGAVRLMVVDVTSAGAMRGYAQFDAAAVAALPAEASVPRLLGAGYLAFTVDQGEDTDRYQGIVELTGASLVECVQHYFQQSEQLQASFKLAASRQGGTWHSGVIMLQRLPQEGPVGESSATEIADEAWRRAVTLLASCTSKELLDTGLPLDDLLYRLFHEDGVRVYKGQAPRAQCRCSRHRVESVLRSLPQDELKDLEVEGGLEVTCEFCNTHYRFTLAELAGEAAG
ncbi:MAG TPA: Hsp33 family molecular chaperone HslO [Candidatus Binatia bacterium]|nr:Hsp33 family molecular chaperone HslO [Candidatus Binatia bacterium]